MITNKRFKKKKQVYSCDGADYAKSATADV